MFKTFDQIKAGLLLRCRVDRFEQIPVPVILRRWKKMRCMEQVGIPVLHGQDGHHVQPQTGHVHDVLFSNSGCSGCKTGVDTAYSAQPAAGGAYLAQDRYLDPAVITENNTFHLAGAMDDKPDLTVQLRGERSQGTGRVATDNFIRLDSFLLQTLNLPELLCFKTGFIADDTDDATSFLERYG